ncbi:TlpA family protein disulfide reductase [Microaerobacter geothermalis]|uniref:TlpA family protein disulfide reductase n=1 Tax=Microaerobacter geothermalis TaxID=674972 RepID=UPI001F2622A3|nr:TlpA disulfide reductase family protein [Microaerobacter geothermalis]MCF6093646.1 TlpA family protein disulfide reductase [Microaerobacter geothermalis]
MPMRLGTPIPSLEGATEWLNGMTNTNELQGSPVLVHFWAVSCHICHETMPEVVQYKEEFAKHGLQVVGIHMPRQESDTDVEKVKADIDKYNIAQPVAIDNMHKIAEAFENEFVPAFFIFDANGHLKYRAAGDRGFKNVKPKLEEVLGI